MNKVRQRFLAALATSALTLSIAVVAQPAQASDCRYDQWGSSQWKGQKYKCRDGSSMHIKPPSFGGSSWDSVPNNSWERWKGTDNFGNRYNCTWDSWRQSWKCR